MPEDVITGVTGSDDLRIRTADALEEAARKLRTADLSKSDEDLAKILHKAQDHMDYCKQELGVKFHEMEAEYQKRVEPVENIIHDHPLPAVMVALGFGFLFGMLIGRFRD